MRGFGVMLVSSLLGVGLLPACSEVDTPLADGPLLATAPDEPDVDEPGVDPVELPEYTGGTEYVTTANLNLREGPGTEFDVLRVLPIGSRVLVVDDRPQNNFLLVSHEGLEGWASVRYLKEPGAQPPSSEPGTLESAATREGILQRAATGVGFSYWWGHGSWDPRGPARAEPGTCSGSCPSCSHTGDFGADCSGFVAKVWSIPDGNDDPTEDSHPFTTGDFVTASAYWRRIDRGGSLPGDAMAYRSGGAGHVFLYESADPWGSAWVYEARGCATGIVHNLRSTGSQYKGLRRIDL